jgi:hypothetical protein
MLTERKPSGDEASDIPSGVIDRGINGTMLRMDQFGDQERRRPMGNCDSKPYEKPSADKHPESEAKTLQRNTSDHNRATDHHASASS